MAVAKAKAAMTRAAIARAATARAGTTTTAAMAREKVTRTSERSF